MNLLASNISTPDVTSSTSRKKTLVGPMVWVRVCARGAFPPSSFSVLGVSGGKPNAEYAGGRRALALSHEAGGEGRAVASTSAPPAACRPSPSALLLDIRAKPPRCFLSRLLLPTPPYIFSARGAWSHPLRLYRVLHRRVHLAEGKTQHASAVSLIRPRV